MPLKLVEIIGDSPNEDPGVPQIAFLPHSLGARTIGLFDESRDASDAGLHFTVRLDIAESGIRARRYDANREQTVMPCRSRSRSCERLAKAVLILHRPIGVHGDHDRVCPGPLTNA